MLSFKDFMNTPSQEDMLFLLVGKFILFISSYLFPNNFIFSLVIFFSSSSSKVFSNAHAPVAASNAVEGSGTLKHIFIKNQLFSNLWKMRLFKLQIKKK